MNTAQLYTQLVALPDNLKKEVADFIAFLQSKASREQKLKKRKFGCAKGFFKLSPDFDEPLEDFKAYM